MKEFTSFYDEQIEECKTRIKVLHKQFERAGVADRGDLENKIEIEENTLSYYLAKIEKDKNLKTPDQISIYFYIIVSTKDNVKSNVGEDLFQYFDTERYHESLTTSWKPFKDEADISDLLADIKSQYNISPVFLDGDITDQCWNDLDDQISNSVSIIDLFSLDNKNLLIANKFDTQKAGVLMPLCRHLNEELIAFSDKLKAQFHVLSAKTNKSIVCNCYASELSRAGSFKQELLRIFKYKFPIKNESQTHSDVRNIKI